MTLLSLQQFLVMVSSNHLSVYSNYEVMKKYMLVGGGSLGHINPLINIVLYSQRYHPSIEFALCGNKDSLEEKMANLSGIQFFGLKGMNYNNYTKLSYIGKCIFQGRKYISIIASLFKSYTIIKKEKIQGVIYTGGSSGLGFIIMAIIMGKDILLYESNTIVGNSIKIVSYFTKKKFSAFAINDFIHTGHLLPISFDETKTTKKIERKKTMVVVTGGSVCGESFGKDFFDSCKKDSSLQDNFDIHIIIGKETNRQHNKDKDIHIYGYIDDRKIAEIYRDADISITRGGSNSLAEQDYFGLKKIIIPLPEASHNHQGRNAKAYTGDIIVGANEWDQVLSILNQHIGYKKSTSYHQDSVLLPYERILCYIE